MTACILIVEDQAIIARGLKRELEGLGREVVGMAYTSMEALKAAAELNPDLILMDIGLENDADGIAVASAIRSERDVPVIFLTGFSDPETLERAMSVSPFGHILKPFEIHDIQAAIAAALCKQAQMNKSHNGSRAQANDSVPATEP
jgi:DNA-binding NarL/FixJ family response regulator